MHTTSMPGALLVAIHVVSFGLELAHSTILACFQAALPTSQTNSCQFCTVQFLYVLCIEWSEVVEWLPWSFFDDKNQFLQELYGFTLILSGNSFPLNHNYCLRLRICSILGCVCFVC